MTTIKIRYSYTPDLVRNLYTEQSRRADDVTIELQDSQLTPAARAALLDGVGYSYGYGETLRTILSEHSSLPQIVSLASQNLVGIAVPDPVGSEPDVTQAVRDAETLLVALAARAPDLRAAWDAASVRRGAVAAENSRLEEVERQEKIAAVRGRGLDAILRRDNDGSWESTHRPDSYARIALVCEALGDDAYARADVEAATRNEAEAAALAAKRTEQRVAATAWIAEHAPELAARHAEDLLPTEELLTHVRDQVFGTIDAPRYTKITPADVWHSDECDEPDAQYLVEPATELTAEEYAVLVQIRIQAPEGATVEAREHRGWCDSCNSGERTNRDVVRRSALVTVTALGRTLSREYALS